MLVHQTPDAFQEAVCAFHAGFLPLKRHIRRGGEHHEQTHGVGAVTLNHLLRVDAVVFGLRHFAHAGIHQLMARGVARFHDAAFLIALDDGVFRGDPVTFAVRAHVVERVRQHHALAQQLFRWFVRVHHTRVAHQLVEEAEVEQVHDGVFDAADINIDRQPVVGRFLIQHAFFVLRAGVARVVPGGFHEGVEGVGFTQRRLAVNGRFRPLRVCFNRAGDAVHDHIFRQDHRQLIGRRRHNGAVFQGHHRDWRAPVTLTGNPPVAQAIVHFALAHAFGGEFVGNRVKARFEVQSVKFTGVKQHAFFGERLFAQIRRGAFCGQDNGFNRQTVFGCEFIVALVVARNGHNGAGAIFHQHEVRRPYRDSFAGQRVNRFNARVDAFLLHGRHIGFGDFGVATFGDEIAQRRVSGCRGLRQRMTRRNGQIGDAHKGIRAGGVHRQLFVAVLNVEGDFHAFRAANPVALHGFNGIRPVVELIQIV
ncbi:conserved hypothetical protein [Cronobacter universalis NCTC 9529]|nr:conserved hypothetical protein [Cronobacter universalis NCTC 9529]